MGRPKHTATAAAATLTAVDLTNGTTTDPNATFHADTTWGTTQRVKADTNHGTIGDTGMDGGMCLADIGNPTGKAGLRVMLSVPTPPESNGSGADEGLCVVVAPSSAPGRNDGFKCGLYVESADDSIKMIDPTRLGSGGKSTVKLDDSADAPGPVTVQMSCYFASSMKLGKAAGYGSGDDAFDAGVISTDGDVAFTTTCWVGLGLMVEAASPSAAQDWGSAIVVSYEWIERTS